MRELLLIITFSFFVLFADAQLVRKYSNEFLSIGVGGRALGMANANVATVDDITSGYWNPAGLANIYNDIQIAGMHSEYFAGIAKYDYAAIAMPIQQKERFIGLSILRFAVDDIPNTLFLIGPDGRINYDNLSSFSAADYAFIFSYAQNIFSRGRRVAGKNWDMERMNVGGNAKIVHRTVGKFATAWGVGLDLGLQYFKQKWRFGATARDITTTYNAWSFNFTDDEKQVLFKTGNEVPESSVELTVPKVILGAAYNFEINEKISILPEVNLDLNTDGKRNVLISAKPVSVDPHIGVEGNYNNFVFLRLGIGNIQRATDDVDGLPITTFQPNGGIGLRLKNTAIDYAYTNIGNASQALFSHVVSLKIEIDKQVKSKKRRRK